jgi:hypothetical protein
MPGKKSTNDEVARRVFETRKLLEAGAYVHEVKAAIRGDYGVCADTVRTYIRRARKQILAQSKRPADVHRAEAVAFYKSLIGNPDVSDKTRVTAQRYLCKLLGLEGPEKHAITDAKGNDIANPTDSERIQFNALLDQLRDRSGKNGVDPAIGKNGKSNGSPPAS